MPQDRDSIDPAAVVAAMKRLKSGLYSHGRERSMVAIETARLADLETIADAVEHYRAELANKTEIHDKIASNYIDIFTENKDLYQQLAAATERAERMRMFDPLTVGCQWEDADDIAYAVHRACIAIIDGKEPNQEGNDNGN